MVSIDRLGKVAYLVNIDLELVAVKGGRKMPAPLYSQDNLRLVKPTGGGDFVSLDSKELTLIKLANLLKKNL